MIPLPACLKRGAHTIFAAMFRDRNLLIATQHRKEDAIAPLMSASFGLHCYTHPNLDTDSLGTFTGEKVRQGDALSTAREKCRMAAELSGADLVLASEGSFGPHPNLYFIPADDEILVLLDLKYNIEIIARELSTETNFAGKDISSEEELLQFAARCQFPSHGLIIRPNEHSTEGIIKGITDEDLLRKAFRETVSIFGQAHVQTDMRAMFNPTRMKVIARAAEKLCEKMASACPNCQMPGFSVTEVVAGLPCALCTAPTRSALKYVYACSHCGHVKEELFPKGKTTEDPMYCDRCNP